jgi:hypothetical protein
MKTIITIAAVLAMTVNAATADVYAYACKVTDTATENVHLYAAKLDTGKRTFTFRGVTYGNLRSNDTDCKMLFRATSRNGAIELCTATQGVATLTVTGSKGADEFDCDIVRR